MSIPIPSAMYDVLLLPFNQLVKVPTNMYGIEVCQWEFTAGDIESKQRSHVSDAHQLHAQHFDAVIY